jgi:Uma2 family endonuclease
MTAEDVTTKLTLRLATHLGPSSAAYLSAAGTRLPTFGSPETARTPDIAFTRRERLDPEPVTGAELVPDLVVDVLTPDDRPLAIQSRAGEWLAAGTSLVWVIDPRRRTVHVYRADGTEEFIASTGSLDGEDLLPGFSCPLDHIF